MHVYVLTMIMHKWVLRIFYCSASITRTIVKLTWFWPNFPNTRLNHVSWHTHKTTTISLAYITDKLTIGFVLMPLILLLNAIKQHNLKFSFYFLKLQYNYCWLVRYVLPSYKTLNQTALLKYFKIHFFTNKWSSVGFSI